MRVDKGDSYICEICLEEFIAARTYEDALAEGEMIHRQEIPPDEQRVICDDCFKRYLKWFEKR